MNQNHSNLAWAYATPFFWRRRLSANLGHCSVGRVVYHAGHSSDGSSQSPLFGRMTTRKLSIEDEQNEETEVPISIVLEGVLHLKPCLCSIQHYT